MSVHGEYQRVFRVVQVRLVEAADAIGANWVETFARLESQEGRDLSDRARAALEVVDRLESELDAVAAADVAERLDRGAASERLAPLRDACHRLKAHCRAILGLGSAD